MFSFANLLWELTSKSKCLLCKICKSYLQKRWILDNVKICISSPTIQLKLCLYHWKPFVPDLIDSNLSWKYKSAMDLQDRVLFKSLLLGIIPCPLIDWLSSKISLTCGFPLFFNFEKNGNFIHTINYLYSFVFYRLFLFC